MNFPAVVEWTDLGHGKGLPVAAALVLLGAVSLTLVAAYQWAGRLGIFGEATTFRDGSKHPYARARGGQG